MNEHIDIFKLTGEYICTLIVSLDKFEKIRVVVDSFRDKVSCLPMEYTFQSHHVKSLLKANSFYLS